MSLSLSNGQGNAILPSQAPASTDTDVPIFSAAANNNQKPCPPPTKMPLFWPLSFILRIDRLPGQPTVSHSANIVHWCRDCIQLAACTVWLFGGVNITKNNLLHSGPSGHTIKVDVENEGAEDMSIRLLV